MTRVCCELCWEEVPAEGVLSTGSYQILQQAAALVKTVELDRNVAANTMLQKTA